MNSDSRRPFACETLEAREMMTASGGYEAPVDSTDTYQVGHDSPVGYNMITFISEGSQGKEHWVEGVRELHASGATEVTLAVYRKVDGESGRILSGTGPRYGHILAATEEAKNLGMRVTITPIFEVEGGGESGWRGEWNPEGKAETKFKLTYRRFLYQLARYAERGGADRFNVGSELESFVRDWQNTWYLMQMTDVLDTKFSGELGYVANWSNYDHALTEQAFWNEPEIDVMGISAYFSFELATPDEADQSHLNDEAFTDLVEDRWNDLFDNELIPYAQSVGDGELALVIQEFGVTPFKPFERCSLVHQSPCINR